MGRTMLNQSKYIKTIPFSGLFNWSVQYLSETKISFNAAYPLVRIGEFLKRNKTGIEIQDDVRYTRVTIRVRNGGVTIRDTEIGNNIGTKRQFVVSKGQFILSKIDARNGAMGIIPAELDGAIVTQDFLPYDINAAKINPQYLVLVSTTAEFVAFCQTCSSGTTNRQRIEENKFLDIKIPLPSLAEQNALVAAYNDLIETAKNQDINATALEQQIETYISSQLGVTISNAEKKFGLNFINFSEISRWDVYNSKSIFNCDLFKNTTLSSIVSEKPKYGAGFKSSDTITDVRYIRITDINEDGTLNSDVVSAEKFDAQYLLKENDFLIARSGNTVGKTFLYEKKYGAAIYAGYLIKFRLNQKIINPKYLLYYTKSKIYKQWINSNMRVSAQPNINSQQYLDSPIIIPPLEVQNRIVVHISEQKEQIKLLRTEASINRNIALTDFEQKIFG